jgi:hypothetical protein
MIARKLPEINKQTKKVHLNFSVYKNIFKNIMTRHPKLRIVMMLGVLITMIFTAFEFFIPIEIYQNSHNLWQIAVFSIVLAMPAVL